MNPIMTPISYSARSVAGAVLTLAMVAGVAPVAHAAEAGASAGAYLVDLDPLNNSGVSGIAVLAFAGDDDDDDDDELSVIIAAQGLEAGEIHPQHIHSLGGEMASTCPGLSADADGDNLISVEEGAPAYGGIALALEPFPTADDDGLVVFRQTYDLGDDDADEATGTLISREDLAPLENRVIVLHGLTVPGQGYIATLPVACGRIESAIARIPAGGGDGDDNDVDDDNGDDSTDDNGADDAD